MALNKLTSGSAVTPNAATYASAPISPASDRVVVAFVVNFAGLFATAPQPVATGNGLAWEQVETVTMGADSRRLTCFVARGGTPSAGPVTFTFTAQQDLCAWSIFEYDAMPGNAMAVITKYPNATTQNVATLSLSPNLPVNQYQVAVGGVLVEAPNQPSRVVTAGTGCAQIDIQAPSQAAQFGPSATLHTEERTTPGPLEWNWNGRPATSPPRAASRNVPRNTSHCRRSGSRGTVPGIRQLAGQDRCRAADAHGGQHPSVRHRGKIRAAYATDPELRDSQFWYHAELFDTDRLLHLAERVEAPDLHAVASSLRHPALLCYYLFFAEREQTVAGSGNTEAKEVGSHAGQWACIALLLERASTADDYGQPTFIGFTGSPTVPPTPHATDDEFRTAMKVVKWRPPGAQPLPAVTGSHPHLRVSLGAHSLYLDEADHQVAPFPTGKEPSDQGRADAPYSTPGRHELWAEFGDAFPPETVPPDDSPATGQGTTVHPAGVAPASNWPNPKPWRSAQHVSVDGRHYDYLVDRAVQPWWPSDDGRQGFRGRWGQRVETDPFNRRAGMRLPPFWRLFLLALEQGRQQGQL